MHLHQQLASQTREAHTGRRVVIDSTRVADGLHSDCISDSTPNPFSVSDVAEPTWQLKQFEPALFPHTLRQGDHLQVSKKLRHRSRAIDSLTSRQRGSV